MTTCLPSPQQIVKTPCRSGCWRLARPKQTRRSSSHRLTASAPSVLSLPSATSLSSLICNNRWIIELAFIMRLTKLHRGRTGRKKKHRTMGQPPQKKKYQKFWILKERDLGETTLQENSITNISLSNASHTLATVLSAA